MHIPSIAIFIFALVGSISAKGTPTHKGFFSVNDPANLARQPRSAPPPAPRTNAKRLALGLPPLPPGRRDIKLARTAAYALSPRQSPPPPTIKHCNLRVKTDAQVDMGFLAATFNNYNQYGIFTTTQSAALELDMKPVNGPSDNLYPAVGGIVPYGATGALTGSGEYLYLGGTYQSGGGADPTSGMSSVPGSQLFESAIWTYVPGTGEVSPHWVNPGSVYPNTYTLYANDINHYPLTGAPSIPMYLEAIELFDRSGAHTHCSGMSVFSSEIPEGECSIGNLSRDQTN
ncbi:hypothetical protein DFH09DRAFT_1100451 [Mycena vulgaris]|nr:hypothetical protein DFH09DRAFT_1100451 [Mycena vulgaris]